MKIQITVEIPDEELRATIQSFIASLAEVGAAESSEPAKPKKAKTEKKVEPETETKAAAEPTSEPKVEAPAESAEVPSPPVSRDELLERCAAFMKSAGTERFAGILKDLGVSRVRECPDEKVADLLAAISVS